MYIVIVLYGPKVFLSQKHNLHDCSEILLGQVLKAVMLVSKGSGYYSAATFKHAILKFYVKNNLIPKGMQVEMDCIQKWSLKMALALRRMVP